MIDNRTLGTLQVDVDELWVYYESIGRPTPESALSVVYRQGIPRLLDLFDRFGIRATFFVCGRDLPAQAATVAEMVRRGHEVANHSASHRNGFARLSPADKRADIAAAGRAIAQVTGQQPVGFKSPGFSFSRDLWGVLAELGYLYDSSLLPTFYAPLLRALQRQLSHGHVDPTHYGRAAHGLAPLKPWQVEARSLKLDDQSPTSTFQPTIWEAPVTTMPLTRLPMHSTFVLSAGQWLFDLGLALVKARRVPINYLLHAADVVDAVPDPALASYRFLTQSWDAKCALYEHMLGSLSATFHLVPTREFLKP
jgi:peptidoglycan/xylan/chitin deacetylase (PgdA/CDA1 family)